MPTAGKAAKYIINPAMPNTLRSITGPGATGRSERACPIAPANSAATGITMAERSMWNCQSPISREMPVIKLSLNAISEVPKMIQAAPMVVGFIRWNPAGFWVSRVVAPLKKPDRATGAAQASLPCKHGLHSSETADRLKVRQMEQHGGSPCWG